MKFFLLSIKWIAVVFGLPILIWILYTAVSAIFPTGQDVSQLDLGHQFELNETARPDTLPNILLIMADDLGYGDLSCYGSPAIKTPHLDSLAAQGMRFTQHYAGASVCSPSRAALMTGRYPARAGFSAVITPDEMPYGKRFLMRMGKVFDQLGALDYGKRSKYNGLRHQEVTLAECLKLAGYRTGISGKWHLGDLKVHEEFNPMYHGFDDFLGLNAANDEPPAALFDRDSMLIEDVGYDQDFLTRIFAERAIEFIEQAPEAPFFYFLSFTAPHLPLVPSEEFKGTSKGGIYGDVVEEMDHYIGTVLNKLDELGLADNTIVLFTSDNGPWFKGSAGDFRGRKGQSYEGGFRVPFIAKWPDRIPAGTTCDAAVMNFDVFPTLLDIAGLENPSDRIIDGKDLQPLWANPDQESLHDYLFFYHFDNVEGVLSNQWKYFDNINHFVWPILLDRKGLVTHDIAKGFFDEQHPNLYDLDMDQRENYDLMHHYPEVVDSLQQVIRNWEAEMERNPEGWLNR
ncbi:MAG: sulfatase [Bacteroidota bacterium]